MLVDRESPQRKLQTFIAGRGASSAGEKKQLQDFLISFDEAFMNSLK
jgi:hypothetical protein